VNIIVIANCHVQPVRDALALSHEVDEVFSVPIHLVNTIHYTNAIEQIKNSNKQKFTVLQFDGLLEKANLGNDILSRIDRVLSFTNIYFSGLHPDITYFGGMGKRVMSPLGDYHSRICLLSFIKGYSLDQCTNLFNSKNYDQLDYYKEWDKSDTELRRRDSTLDIKFADGFLEMTKNEPTLYTFNHPLGPVFYHLAEKIFTGLELAFPKFPTSYFYNYLATNAWWPIYPEIGDFNSIKFDHPMIFKSPDHLSRKFYSLEQFVAASFALYAQQGLTTNELPAHFANILERI
jgi:hypothetical protein